MPGKKRSTTKSTMEKVTTTVSNKSTAFLKKPYARVLTPEDDGTYSAEVLELSGCFAQGDSPSEAIENLNCAAAEWIEASLARGQEIPEPSETRGYSGTISLRIPKGLHKRAAKMAERNGVSLNQFLVSAISAAVGAGDLYSRFVERMSDHAGSGWGRIIRVYSQSNVSFTITPSQHSLSESIFGASFLGFIGEAKQIEKTAERPAVEVING